MTDCATYNHPNISGKGCVCGHRPARARRLTPVEVDLRNVLELVGAVAHQPPDAYRQAQALRRTRERATT